MRIKKSLAEKLSDRDEKSFRGTTRIPTIVGTLKDVTCLDVLTY